MNYFTYSLHTDSNYTQSQCHITRKSVFMKMNQTTLCSHCTKLQEQKEQQHYFISHLTHEVRNPLTLISSSLQLLETECPSVKNSVLWSQIREDVQSTIGLLQDISAFNNINKLTLTEFPAEDFLSSITRSFSSYMEQRNILFSAYQSPSIASVSLKADRRKLQEALTNLLINAADALCDPKSALSGPRKIDFTAEHFDKILHIHVKDNGPGIPNEYLETLFDPFVTHKASGTGLGLSIVKSVAELHGGHISVEISSELTSSELTCCEPVCSYTDFHLEIPVM